MNWVLITITFLSLISSIIAWIAKLQWSKEYKEAKEAQITTLREKVNHLKELSSSEMIEYFKESKKYYEESLKEANQKLVIERRKNREGNYSKEEYEEKIEELLNEKETMLAELHHRVKNNLAVISGLVQLYLYSSDDEHVNYYLEQITYKIYSIAITHELLYNSESLSKIKTFDLINELAKKNNLNSNVEGQREVEMNINQAVPLSLIINELFWGYKRLGVLELKIEFVLKNSVFLIYIRSPKLPSDAESIFKKNIVSTQLFNMLIDQLGANVSFGKETVIKFNEA